MACSHSNDCNLYQQFVTKGSLKIWKILYCEDDKKTQDCARHKLSVESKPIPANLLPDGTLLGNGP